MIFMALTWKSQILFTSVIFSWSQRSVLMNVLGTIQSHEVYQGLLWRLYAALFCLESLCFGYTLSFLGDASCGFYSNLLPEFTSP